MIKLDIKAIEPVIKKYVEEFYTKPKTLKNGFGDYVGWFQPALSPIINKQHIAYELAHLDLISIPSGSSTEKCIPAPLKVKAIHEYGYFRKAYQINDKEVIFVLPIYLDDKSKPLELKNYIDNMSTLMKKCGELGISPKVHECYMCNDGSSTYISVRMEYIKSESLKDLMDKELSKADKEIISKIISEKVELLHKNNISFGGYVGSNSIFVVYKDNKPSDVFVMDLSSAIDLTKSAEDSISRDLKGLKWLIQDLNKYKRVDPDNLSNYVIGRMLEDRKISINL
jgi:serine/threonine protein kinase